MWEDLLSSVCCRASSATASAILALTVATVSEAKHCSNFARIASRSACCRVRNRSAVLPFSNLRGFEDWRRKMTAANDRVCERLRQNVRRVRNSGSCTDRGILCQLYLLREAHQEHIGPLANPFPIELLLRGGALYVVWRLQALEQVGESRVNFRRKNRHGDVFRCVVRIGSRARW